MVRVAVFGAEGGGDAVPLGAAIPLGLLLVLTGIGILEVARRARGDKLTPQGAVGVRTTATARSEDAWFTGQRAAAPLFAVSGAACALAGVIFLARPSTALAALVVVVAAQITAGFALGGIARGHKAASRSDR